MAIRQRRAVHEGQQEQSGNLGGAPVQQLQQPATRARLVVMLIATAVATAGLAVQNPQLQQQLSAALAPLQQHLPTQFQGLLQQISSSIGSKVRGGKLFTAEELSRYTSDNPEGGGKIYVAILGEVFDVSSKPEFYAAGNGYGHFAGTDGSKSFITGDFINDVSDDVSDLDAQACLGLMGWLDFYHKTYPYVGKRVGRFFDETGHATPALASVHERAEQGKLIKAEEEDEYAKWPNCNSKWTEAEGGRVWCDNGRYPRKLYVNMVNGRPTWRCACFEELGWSDLRQVYPECDPNAHSCSTNPSGDDEASKAADEAVISMLSQ